MRTQQNKKGRYLTGKFQGRMAFRVIGLKILAIFMNGLVSRRTRS